MLEQFNSLTPEQRALTLKIIGFVTLSAGIFLLVPFLDLLDKLNKKAGL